MDIEGKEQNINKKDFIFDRKNYNYEIRKAFSNKNSILKNGDINHKYFQTKVGQYWSDEETIQLMKGIEEYGVGFFDKIKFKYLKLWSETELRLRTSLLLKCFKIDENKGRS